MKVARKMNVTILVMSYPRKYQYTSFQTSHFNNSYGGYGVCSIPEEKGACIWPWYLFAKLWFPDQYLILQICLSLHLSVW